MSLPAPTSKHRSGLRNTSRKDSRFKIVVSRLKAGRGCRRGYFAAILTRTGHISIDPSLLNSDIDCDIAVKYPRRHHRCSCFPATWPKLRRAVEVGSTTGASFAFAVGVGPTTSAALPVRSSLKILRLRDLEKLVTDRAESFTPVYRYSDFRTSHHSS